MTTTEILFELMRAATSLTGYEYPYSIPEIDYVPYETMRDIMILSKICSSTDKRYECNVKAVYLNLNGVVYLDEHSDIKNSPLDRSFVVHEFVHYLQAKYNSYEIETYTCSVRAGREDEAFKAQNEYLVEEGIDKVYVPVYPCQKK